MTLYSVYITVPGHEEAETIAETLVDEHLAACVNIFPSVHSIYRWQGTVHSDHEEALVVKTTEGSLPALINRVRELHSYTCPCIEAFPIETGNADFLAWIEASCINQRINDAGT